MRQEHLKTNVHPWLQRHPGSPARSGRGQHVARPAHQTGMIVTTGMSSSKRGSLSMISNRAGTRELQHGRRRRRGSTLGGVNEQMTLGGDEPRPVVGIDEVVRATGSMDPAARMARAWPRLKLKLKTWAWWLFSAQHWFGSERAEVGELGT
jgi:hypothetical protein